LGRETGIDDRRISDLAEDFCKSTNFDMISQVIKELPDDIVVLRRFLTFCLPHIKSLNKRKDPNPLSKYTNSVNGEIEWEIVPIDKWKDIDHQKLSEHTKTYPARMYLTKCILMSYLRSMGWLPLRSTFGSRIAFLLKISIKTVNQYLETLRHDRDFRISKDPNYLKQEKENPEIEQFKFGTDGFVLASFSKDDLIDCYGKMEYH